jgi:hypothetical protein
LSLSALNATDEMAHDLSTLARNDRLCQLCSATTGVVADPQGVLGLAVKIETLIAQKVNSPRGGLSMYRIDVC